MDWEEPVEYDAFVNDIVVAAAAAADDDDDDCCADVDGGLAFDFWR